MANTDRKSDEEGARKRRERESNERLPAGLDDEGRDEGLEHAEEVHSSGLRSDYRPSVPGTGIPEQGSRRDKDRND